MQFTSYIRKTQFTSYTSGCKIVKWMQKSQVHRDRHDEDLAEFGKNATLIMIFLPHYEWAENNKLFNSYSYCCLSTVCCEERMGLRTKFYCNQIK